MSNGKRKLSKAEDQPSSESEADFIATRVSRSRSRGRSVTRKSVRSRSRSETGNNLVRGRLRKLNGGENACSTSQINSEDDSKCSRSTSKARSCIAAFDRGDSIDKPKRKRGRPPKLRDVSTDTFVVSDNEKEPQRIRSASNSARRSRSRSISRPKRNARRPKKLLTDSSSEASQASCSDEEEAVTGSKKKKILKKRSHLSNTSLNYSGEEQRGTKCGARSTRSNSFNLKENIESEQCKDVTSSGETKKRKLSPEPLPKITGDKDVYCWQCHRHGNNMLSCHVCPRVYHRRCAKIDSDPEVWTCLECNSTVAEGRFQNLSDARSLTQDELNQLFMFIIERILCQDGAKHFRNPVDLTVYPKYRDYIIHPMDLTLVEKNINNNKYKTTESFVADMKWLVHNSYIFNTPYSELTTYAKRILKIVKQETEEIDTCSHCYFHYHTMEEDTWFVEPCKKPHLLVWAKLRGFPHWPAKVMRVVNDLVDVRFFGDHNRSWLNPESCYLFSKSSPFPNKMGYQKDYGDCLKEVFIHIKHLQDTFKEFHFSPPRLKFVPAEHEKLLSSMLPLLNLSAPESQKKDDDQLKFSCLTPNVSSLKNVNVSSGNSPQRNFFTSKTDAGVGSSPMKNCLAVLRKYEPLNKLKKPVSKENLNTILHEPMNENLIPEPTRIEKCQSPEDCMTPNIKQEIIDGDYQNAYCNLNQDSLNLCKSKSPQVVLTRIHVNGELNKHFSKDPVDPVITKESQITNATPYLHKEVNISGEVEGRCVGKDSFNILTDVEVTEKENTGGVSPTNSISHEGGSENNSGNSSRIMLKVKSSAELLSSEALIKHNEKSIEVSVTHVGETDKSSCKKVVGSDELVAKPKEASKKQYPQPDDLNMCQSYNQSLTKMNATIEKVIRGEITAVLPSRELKTKSTPEPDSSNNKLVLPTQSKVVNVTAAELESESDENSESEVIENISVLSDEGEDNQVTNVNLDQELIPSQNLTDVSAWSIEPFVENPTIIDSLKDTFNDIEQSQNLEDCKKLTAHLKKLAYLQRKEMENFSKKIKAEAKEVFEIFMNEKEKLVSQKKELAKTVKNIKLTQWCNFCLKEANFYCCWGTSYCSKDCQHKDWDIHFEYCKQSENDSDKLRVANPGSISKFRLPPSVTINKLSNSTSSSNQLTITKTAGGGQVTLAKTISQGILQPSVTAIKKTALISPAVIKPSETTINKSISLTSKSLYLAGSSSSNSKLFKVTTGVLERTPRNLLGKKDPRSEPQKIIIRTDQLKSISESISGPGMYKIPVNAFPKSSQTLNSNLILSNSQVKLINSHNVPYIVQRPTTSQNTSNQKTKYVVFKQQSNCIPNIDKIKTITL